MQFNFSKIANNFSRIIILLVIIYILVNLGRSILGNYKVNEKIVGVNNEISDLEEENQFLKNQNLYYQTDIFKELEARRKLGLKAEGENVVIAPDNSDTADSLDNSSISISNKNVQNKTTVVPNYVKWWWYMLGRTN